MGDIFFELTLILCLVAFLSIIFRLLKQPTILAYILTGIIIGPFGQLQLGSNQFLQAMGQFGITLLLFMLGLEMQIKEFRSIGKTAIFVGIGQIVSALLLSFSLSSLLKFSLVESFYIAVALAFSSTIIVVKLLAEKKDLKSLYGRISIGILLIQDFIAVLILVLLSGAKLQSLSANFFPLILVLLKAAILFFFVIYLSRYIFPKVIDKIAKSEESLFLFSLAWVFGLSALVSSKPIGFSLEIGGFLAGIALANASENFQIIARMKALRDFFITIFFVFLGMKMMFNDFFSVILMSVIFSVFVILIKPLIIMVLMGLGGFRRRTSFLTGITLSQISEFSLIIIFLGSSLGHINNNIVSIVASVLIITFITSSYLIIHSNSLYKLFGKYFLVFEKKQPEENLNISKDSNISIDHVVLVGAHRMGESILNALEDIGDKVIVVDFDPEIVAELNRKGILSIFGDIADTEIQERAQIKNARLVVSTVPDVDDNLILIKGLNHSNRLAKIIVMAQDSEDAKTLYKAGADYVVLSHLSGGRHVAKILKEDKLDLIDAFKTKDLKEFQ